MGAFIIRLVNNMALPLFVDETYHIIRGQLFLDGVYFAGIEKNKWLFGPFIAIFNPTGPEAPFIGRYVNILLGILTLALTVKIGARLADWRTGLLAGAFYMVVPLAAYHEREALVDPLMGVFAAASVWVTLSMVRRPNLRLAVLLSMTLALSRLTKASMVGFFLLPFAGVVLFTLLDDAAVTWRNAISILRTRLKQPLHRQKFMRTLAYTAIGVALSLVIVGVAYQIADQVGGQVSRSRYSLELRNFAFHLIWGRAAPGYLTKEFVKFAQVHLLFLTPSVLILMAAAVLASFTQQDQRVIAFLLIPAVLFAFIPVFAERPVADGSELPARYFYQDAPWSALLAALGVAPLVGWLKRRLQSSVIHEAVLNRWMIALSLLIPFAFTMTLIVAPRQSPLVYPAQDIWRGYLHEDMIHTLQAAHAAEPEKPMQIYVNGPEPLWLETHFGPRVANIETGVNLQELSGAALDKWLADDYLLVLLLHEGCPNFNEAISPAYRQSFYCFELEA